MQTFKFLHPLASVEFVSQCRAIEFCSDVYRAFDRTIIDIRTIEGYLIVTVDQDIQESSGADGFPAFELNYYGMERI